MAKSGGRSLANSGDKGSSKPRTKKRSCQTRCVNRSKASLSEAILDNSSYAIIATDTDGIITSFNQAATKLLGYNAQELVGKHNPGIFHDPGEVVARSQQLSEQFGHTIEPGFETFIAKTTHGLGNEDEWTYVHKSGRKFPVTLSITSIRNAQGEVTGYLGIAKDISDQKQNQLRLAESEEKFRSLSASAPIGIYLTNESGACTFVNQTWCDLAGMNEKDALGFGWANALHPEDRERVSKAWESFSKDNGTFLEEYRFLRNDGSIVWLNGRATAVLDQSGHCTGYVGTIEDITSRLKNQIEISNQKERLRVTLQSIGDAVITTDLKGTVEYLNPCAEFMTGWASEEAEGEHVREVFDLMDEVTKRVHTNPIEKCLEVENIVGMGEQSVLISRDGTEYAIEGTASPIRDELGRLLGGVLVFSDVTEQRNFAKEIKYQAAHDALTDAYNRQSFEDLVETAFSNKGKGTNPDSVLYIDLDRFKLVNDTCGHAAGDLVLQKVVEILNDNVRSTDVVARIGGDEFAILLYNCPQDRAFTIAQSICNEVSSHRFNTGDCTHRIGASIGLVPIEDHWDNYVGVLQAADSACYVAKESGRNRVHVHQKEEDGIHQEQSGWASRIESALDENRFVLHAQRIAPNANRKHENHYEVLIRMIDEEGDLVFPGAFIPPAERFHLIGKIDRWVFDTVLSTLNQLKKEKSPLPRLFMNLSGRSFNDPQIRDYIESQIGKNKDLAKNICLEITETVALSNIEQTVPFMKRMRKLGVKFALDDFGSGVSSFAYLKNLPADLLKIDGEFVKGISKHPVDHMAVRHMIEYAEVLGLESIAEFVEDESTRESLESIGVDYLQGYLIHRPEPLENVIEAYKASFKQSA